MITFRHPSNILIVGPSGSGKTTCALRIILDKMLVPFPENIYFLYNIRQDFGGELGYSGDASPHKSHQIPLDKTGSGSIMDPPARGATA